METQYNDIHSLKSVSSLVKNTQYVDFSRESSIKRVKSKYLLLAQSELIKNSNNKLLTS